VRVFISLKAADTGGFKHTPLRHSVFQHQPCITIMAAALSIVSQEDEKFSSRLGSVWFEGNRRQVTMRYSIDI